MNKPQVYSTLSTTVTTAITRIAAVAAIICIIAAGLGINTSCSSGEPSAEEIEERGQMWLRKARIALADGDFGLARIFVDSLRERTPMALNAREEGIVLLDSIELAEAIDELHRAKFIANQSGLDYIAKDSLDTKLDRVMMKVKFFEKKIRHDQANMKQH